MVAQKMANNFRGYFFTAHYTPRRILALQDQELRGSVGQG